MEVKRIDFQRAAERIGATRPEVQRQRNSYADDDCRKLVQMIGDNLCPGKKFVIDNQNEFVYEHIRRWCDGNPDFLALDPKTGKQIRGDLHKGLYIAGNSGSGKTLCTRIFCKYVSMMDLKIKTNDLEPSSLAWHNHYAAEICEYYARTGNVSQLTSLPSLCIQDVGSEPPEVLYMGNKISVIGYLLQMRGERSDYITIITSNNRITEDMYGDRVTSRLFSMCNYYELKGNDRRL